MDGGPSLDKVANLGYAISQITVYTVSVPVNYFITNDLNQKNLLVFIPARNLLRKNISKPVSVWLDLYLGGKTLLNLKNLCLYYCSQMGKF